MPKIVYECVLDLSNPNNNIAPTYPLIQGTDVEFQIEVLDNGNAIDIEELPNGFENNVELVVKPYIVSYCKLDNAPVVMTNTEQTLEIEYNSELPDHRFIVKGLALANTAGKNALMLKYSNGFVTYSTPLYYYVEFNPISQLPTII